MQLCYEKTIVRGLTPAGREIREDIIHLENQDPILMAMRRNNDMTSCMTVRTQTVEVFRRHVDESPWAGRRDIPRQHGGWIEYGW